MNVTLSKRMKRIVKAKKNECYVNAWNSLPHLGPAAKYVEGYIISHGLPMPIEHGWAELNGEVIDPTLIHPENVYFPAKTWTLAESIAALNENGRWMPISYFMGEEAYEASCAAWKHLGIDIKASNALLMKLHEEQKEG